MVLLFQSKSKFTLNKYECMLQKYGEELYDWLFFVKYIVGAWAYLLTNDLFIIKEFENDNIISQIVGIGEVCDQNVDRVSRNNKSVHVVTDWRGHLAKYKKYGYVYICLGYTTLLKGWIKLVLETVVSEFIPKRTFNWSEMISEIVLKISV